MIILYTLLGAFFNSFIRGGFLKQWWLSFRGGKIINAIAFGIAAYFASNNWLMSALLAAGMMIGQAPALFDEDSDKYKAIGNWLGWAQVIAERACIWVVPLMAASVYWARVDALWWLLLIPSMPIAYALDWTNWRYRWAAAEMLFGACMWALLYFYH